MHPELTYAGQTGRGRMVRVDGARLSLAVPGIRAWARPMLAIMAMGFVLVGAGNLGLGPADARVGLAARAPLGPLGQVYGSWAPDLWPARVALSQVASLFEQGGRTTPASVLMPAALAAVLAGWLLATRLMGTLGIRAGLWFGLCWFGCLGVIDHSGGTGLDWIAGLGTIAALDRLLARGSDGMAGLWAAFAFLAGGWPPCVVILLAVIVIGRSEAIFCLRLLIPPAVAAVAWSIWTLSVASVEAWAVALAWPLTQRPDWWLAPGVLGLGLPLAPFALLALSRPLRNGWNGPGRQMLAGWAQVALACLIAGTCVPGLAQAARVPALAGILVLAAAGLDAAWTCALPRFARGLFFALTVCLMAAWLFTVVYGGYLWTVVFPYYRPVGIVVLLLSIPVFVLGWSSGETASPRRALVTLTLLTISLKLVHWGYYVPEWNYRYGQGPWGRAIGQWLLPNWTLYTFHDWSPDLAFAIGRPVRKLTSPQHLAYPASPESKHVLLLESEFEHWPRNAPPLLKVATFHDPDGGRRILARTEGILTTPSGLILPPSSNHEYP